MLLENIFTEHQQITWFDVRENKVPTQVKACDHLIRPLMKSDPFLSNLNPWHHGLFASENCVYDFGPAAGNANEQNVSKATVVGRVPGALACKSFKQFMDGQTRVGIVKRDEPESSRQEALKLAEELWAEKYTHPYELKIFSCEAFVNFLFTGKWIETQYKTAIAFARKIVHEYILPFLQMVLSNILQSPIATVIMLCTVLFLCHWCGRQISFDEHSYALLGILLELVAKPP